MKTQDKKYYLLVKFNNMHWNITEVKIRLNGEVDIENYMCIFVHIYLFIDTVLIICDYIKV